MFDKVLYYYCICISFMLHVCHFHMLKFQVTDKETTWLQDQLISVVWWIHIMSLKT